MIESSSSIQVKDIDHLGIVAGIIDQIGLVEIVNQELGNHPQEKISEGIALKAMIMNGLGFLSAPLYLFSQFFEGKATEHLLGEGIEAQHLNDDRLGRVLDQLFPLYLRVADGNETDQGVFAKLIQDFNSQCQIDATFVADAALYSEENLQLLGDLKWISRVPATLKAAVELMEKLPEEALRESQQEGFRTNQSGLYSLLWQSRTTS